MKTETTEKKQTENGTLKWVLRKQVQPDPNQPRRTFDEEKLKALAASIEAKGVRVPLQVELVQGHYRILDGERRWRACELAKVDRIPVMVVEVKDTERMEVQLTLNQQRENLSVLEEAEAFRKEVDGGKKVEDLAKQLGVSRATVFGRLALTRLHRPVREALVAGKISTGVAAAVALVPDPEQQKAVLKEAMEERWNGPMPVRQVQQLIERDYVKQLSKAPWELAQVFGVMPVCAACPKRSGNMAEMFPDLAKRPNVCTDPACYAKKLGCWGAMQIKQAKEKGQTVVEGANVFSKHESYGGEHALSSDQYIDLNDRCQPLGYEYKNHWKAALGKECPPAVLSIDPAGRLRELLPKAMAIEALKRTGKKPTESAYTRNHKEDRRQAQLQERERKEENKAISAALVAKVEQLKDFSAEWLWKLVTEALSDLAGFYVMQPIEKRRGWAVPKNHYYSDVHDEEMGKMTLAQRVALAVEIASSRNEDAQNAVAKALRVDIKKVVAAVKEAKAKPQKNAKGAKKPSSAKSATEGKGKK